MGLGLNWVDLLIAIILLIFILEAFGRSFLSETLDFLSFLLALVLSFRYYNLASMLFEDELNLPHGLSLAAGFTLIWFVTEIIFFFAVRFFIPKIPKFKLPGEKYLAFIPAVLRGLIFISILLVFVSVFPIQPNLKKAVQGSKLAPFILGNAYGLEKPIKDIFGGVTNDTLTFLTIKPKTTEKIDLGFTTNDFLVDPDIEQAMIELVNKERVAAGQKALVFNGKLREVGRTHSEDMLRRGYFSHYSPEGESVADRADKAQVKYMVIGENLAYAPSLDLAHKGLMNSPGHRANILSADFNKIGIGVMDAGIYGKMFVQVFSD